MIAAFALVALTLPAVDAFDGVFHDDDADFVVAVTGDYIPARSFNAGLVESGDFDSPLAAVAPILTGADVAFVSLEAPLLRSCRPTHAGMVFCGDVRHARALAKAGVDVVALENNHIDNHGAQGRSATLAALEDAGIAAASHEPAVVDVNGARVAFLSFNAVSVGYVPRASWKRTVERVKARADVDVVIVQVHWGAEYVDLPQKTTENVGAPNEPRALARLLVQAGADLVVGNHPHVVQGMELVERGTRAPAGKKRPPSGTGAFVPVVYAHGNFLFDQLGKVETRTSVIGLYAFRGGRVVDVAFVPLRQEALATAPLAGDEASQVVSRLADLSRAIRRRR